MAAIFGAISVITAFESSTSLMLLVCYTLYQLLDEYAEKNQVMAAILDAILKMIAFPMWDFWGF